MTFVTRFAPSPTGPLHLGHAFSALTVLRLAAGRTVLLRIEDTDSTRCRPEHEAAILDDLTWLGFHWTGPVRRQSEHLAEYTATLEILSARGLLYPCSCTRRDIAEAGAVEGLEGLVYPGTCRGRGMDDAQPGDALRLNMQAALDNIDVKSLFVEEGPLYPGQHSLDPDMLRSQLGDPVLRRKDTGDPAYHLACPQDDALQGVSHVIRGADLWHATPIHVVLQRLMGWPTPHYHHHDLIRDESGKRLAKIDRSKSIARYRAEGATPADIRRMVGLPAPET